MNFPKLRLARGLLLMSLLTLVACGAVGNAQAVGSGGSSGGRVQIGVPF